MLVYQRVPSMNSIYLFGSCQASSEGTTLLWRWWAAQGCWSFCPGWGAISMGLQYLKMEHVHENWWQLHLFVEVNGFKPSNFRRSHIQICQTLLQRMAMSPFKANLEPTRSNKWSHCSATTCHLAPHLRPVQQQNQPWLPGSSKRGYRQHRQGRSGETLLNYSGWWYTYPIYIWLVYVI